MAQRPMHGRRNHGRGHRHRHSSRTASNQQSGGQGSTQTAKFASCKHCDARINLRGVIIGATGDSCTHEFQYNVVDAPAPSRLDFPSSKSIQDSMASRLDRIPTVLEAEKFRDIVDLNDWTDKQIAKYQKDIQSLKATYGRVSREMNADFDSFVRELQKRRYRLSQSIKAAYEERMKELNELKRTMAEYKAKCIKEREDFASVLDRDPAGKEREAKQVEKADKIINDCPVIFNIPLEVSFSEAGAKMGLEEDIRAFGMIISDDVHHAKTRIDGYRPRNDFGSSRVPPPIDPGSEFKSPPPSQSMAPVYGYNGAAAYRPNPGKVADFPARRLARPSPHSNAIRDGGGPVSTGAKFSLVRPIVEPSVSSPAISRSPSPKPVPVQMSVIAKSVTSVRPSTASINKETGFIQLEIVIRGPRPPAKEGLTIACQVKEKSTGRVIHTEEGNALECHVNRARWKYTLKSDLQSNPANNGTKILVEFRLMCPQTKQIVPKGAQWNLFKESLTLRAPEQAEPSPPAKCFFFVDWKGTPQRVELVAPQYALRTLKYKLIAAFRLAGTGINVDDFRFDLVDTEGVVQISDVQDDSILLSTKYPANSHIYKAVLINESAESPSPEVSQSIPDDLYAKLPARLAFFASPQWNPAERRVFIRNVHGPDVSFESLKQTIQTRCGLDTMDFTMHIQKGRYQGCQLTKKSDFGAIQHKTTVIELRK